MIPRRSIGLIRSSSSPTFGRTTASRKAREDKWPGGRKINVSLILAGDDSSGGAIGGGSSTVTAPSTGLVGSARDQPKHEGKGKGNGKK